jgi:hypothetical protein
MHPPNDFGGLHPSAVSGSALTDSKNREVCLEKPLGSRSSNGDPAYTLQ